MAGLKLSQKFAHTLGQMVRWWKRNQADLESLIRQPPGGAGNSAGTQSRPPRLVLVHEDITHNCQSVAATAISCLHPAGPKRSWLLKLNSGQSGTLNINGVDIFIQEGQPNSVVQQQLDDASIEAIVYSLPCNVFICGVDLVIDGSATDASGATDNSGLLICTQYLPLFGPAFEFQVSAGTLVSGGIRKGDIVEATWRHRCGYQVESNRAGCELVKLLECLDAAETGLEADLPFAEASYLVPDPETGGEMCGPRTIKLFNRGKGISFAKGTIGYILDCPRAPLFMPLDCGTDDSSSGGSGSEEDRLEIVFETPGESVVMP